MPSAEENPSDVSQLPTERGAYPPPPDLPTRVGHERERGREKDSYKDGGDAEMRTRHRRTNSVPSNTQVSDLNWMFGVFHFYCFKESFRI